MNISLIACINSLGYIGKDGRLLYNIPEDMKLFKEHTANKVMIMGRKTYESLPKVLPGRYHIVITSDMTKVCHPPEYDTNRVIFVPDIQYAIGYSKFMVETDNLDGIVFIGGESVYRDCLPYINEAVLTYVNDDEVGDASFPMEEFFPPINTKYKLIEPVEYKYHDGYDYTIFYWKKTDDPSGFRGSSAWWAWQAARAAMLADREQRAQPAPGAEAQRLIYGFMLDCNAIGLLGAAENLHRGIKQVADHLTRGH